MVNLIKDRQIHPNKINCFTYFKKYKKYNEIWPQTCQLNSSAQYCTHTVGLQNLLCVCVCVCAHVCVRAHACVCVCVWERETDRERHRERENTFQLIIFFFFCCVCRTFWCLDDRGRGFPHCKKSNFRKVLLTNVKN